MLVLTRRLGEEIVIDGNICITVVAIKGGHVRLGITAPKSVSIQRSELLDRAEPPIEVRAEAELPADSKEPGNGSNGSLLWNCR
jgi:carbon storage regulator